MGGGNSHGEQPGSAALSLGEGIPSQPAWGSCWLQPGHPGCSWSETRSQVAAGCESHPGLSWGSSYRVFKMGSSPKSEYINKDDIVILRRELSQHERSQLVSWKSPTGWMGF